MANEPKKFYLRKPTPFSVLRGREDAFAPVPLKGVPNAVGPFWTIVDQYWMIDGGPFWDEAGTRPAHISSYAAELGDIISAEEHDGGHAARVQAHAMDCLGELIANVSVPRGDAQDRASTGRVQGAGTKGRRDGRLWASEK